MMMNPRAGTGVKASFLQAQNVVSVRLVRTAPCVCKLFFKVEMQLKYEDICLSLAASVLCCGAAALGEQEWGVLVSPPENSKDVAKPSQSPLPGFGTFTPLWLHQHFPGNPSLLWARTPRAEPLELGDAGR